MRAGFAFVAAAVLGCAQPVEPSPPTSHPDEAELLATINRCFEGMTEHDSAKLASSVRGDAAITRLRTREDGTVDVFTTTGEEFISELSEPGPRYVERIWSPQFLIGERLATVRAPYDFHVDDRFSHCGMDHFTLVRETDGWRIQGIAYTFASKDQALCQSQTPQP